MPNKVTAIMPSKTRFILKYGNNWFYEWDKARKQFNNLMGLSMKVDWYESKIERFKNCRYGKMEGKILTTNIYNPTWVKPSTINWWELPSDLKYHDNFYSLKREPYP